MDKEIDYQNLLDRLSSFYGFKYSCERKYLGGFEAELFKDYKRIYDERPKMLVKSDSFFTGGDYYAVVSGFGTTEQNSYFNLLSNVCGREVAMFNQYGHKIFLFNYGSIEEMIIDMDLRGVQWPPK